MKQFARCLPLVCLALPLLAAGARSAFAEDDRRFNDLLQRTIDLPVQQVAAHDYLVQLARAADLNFIADATNIAPDAPTVSQETPARLTQLMFYNLVKPQNIRMVRFDQKTVLFWPAPDLVQLARLVLAEEDAASKAKPAVAPLKEAELNALLKDYFQRAHGWNGDWETANVEVQLDKLPPELRARVQNELRSQVANSAFSPDVEKWFSDAFWSTARLTINQHRRLAGGPLTPFLEVGRFFSVEENGTTWNRGGFRVGQVPTGQVTPHGQ